jgi:hypothetical protein
MPSWKALAHFLYGQGFWYADPVDEIDGLAEEQLFWVPAPKALCILWQLGHIAHRERVHVGHFLEGLPPDSLIPPAYEVFGTEWCSADDLCAAIRSVPDVLAWVRAVRARSHAYIETLTEEAFHSVPPTSEIGLSVAHWLFITTTHTALHLWRIQLLRALIEGERERAC